MKTLQKLKETSSTNEKLEILEQELNKVNEFLIRKALNDEVFGLSTKTLMKVFNIKDLKGYEDISDWIEKEYKYNCITHETLDVNDLEIIFYNMKKYSGNKLINKLKQLIVIFEKEEIIWICRALLKDLKINMSVTSVNKVFSRLDKTLIETFQVQLCAPLKLSELDKLNNYPYFCETKYDGTRTVAFIKEIINNNKVNNLLEYESNIGVEIEVVLKSRQGKDTTAQFPEIVKALKIFAKENNVCNMVLDGEVILKDFNSLQKRLGRLESNIEEDEDLKYIIFDILKYNNIECKQNLFTIRRSLIDSLIYTSKIDYSEIIKCNNKEDIVAFYNVCTLRGEEGIIIKDRYGLYATERKDERKGMWKVKPVETMDLYIAGFEYGTGRHSNTIGALHLSNKDGTIICKCGSGLSDDERNRLLGIRNTNNGLKGRIVEVKYWEINKPDEKGIRSLRFPIYVCLREDKNESD